MKKNILVKIVFITLVFIVIISLQHMVLASGLNPDKYEPDSLTKNDAKTVFFIGEKLFGLLRNVATVVAILTIAIIGVKYIYGSAEQKAEYKTTLVPWFIGAVLIVMVTGLLGVIQNLAQKI